MTDSRTRRHSDDEIDRLLRSTTGAIARSTPPPPELEELEAFASLHDHEEDRMRNRWRTGMVAAAAGLVIAAVVGVLVVASTSDDDEGVADERSSDEADGVASQSVTIGQTLVTAFDEHDQDVIERLVADDATVRVRGANTTGKLGNILRMFGATDTRFELQNCGFDPDAVAGWTTGCVVLERNAWSEALGAEPIEGTFTLRIEDAEVTGIRFRHDSGAWIGTIGGPFGIYVRRQSPEDGLQMFDSTWLELDDDEVDEVIAKFERYTDEFVAAQADS